MYERPLAKAAIDAGADIVVGHHAHILKGIEGLFIMDWATLSP